MRVSAQIACFFLVPFVVVATASRSLAGQDWEVEAHAGALMTTNPTGGASALPPVGPNLPLNGPSPTSITRRVPSWYFGDGAAILNQILGPRSPARIVPLDPILQSPIVERQSGASFGVRIHRSLTTRFGVEFALDGSQSRLALRSPVKDAVAQSQASFLATWNTLLNIPAGGTQMVTTDATLDGDRGRQLVTSGALLINLLSSKAFTPYVAVGAGYIAARGGAPAVAVVGTYDFTFPQIVIPPGIPQFHLNESDNVKIQSVVENSATFVFGGGVKYMLGDRWGVRADLRDYVNRDVIRTRVTTDPRDVFAVAGGTLTFSLAQNAPVLIFSSTPLSLSTLSTTINDFQTFKGNGIVNQVNVSAGVFWRF